MIKLCANSASATIRWCLALIIAASFWGITNTNAQENSKRGKVTFTAIALSDLVYENLYYRSGKKPTKIEFRKSRRSDHYTYPTTAQVFEVYTDPVNPDDPESSYQLVGKAPTIIGPRNILCFFRKSGTTNEGELPLELFSIDDSGAKFPEGSFRFINFMNEPVIIKFADDQFRIAPKESTIRKPKLSEEGAFSPFIVMNTKAQVLGGTRIFSHATNREMVLIFPPKKGKKRLDIRYFSDRAPKPKPESKNTGSVARADESNKGE